MDATRKYVDFGEFGLAKGGKAFISASVEVNGDLVLECCDVGPFVEEVWGDEDYEFSVTIPAERRDWVLLYLLQERFGDDVSAVGSFREWVEERGIAYRFMNWI